MSLHKSSVLVKLTINQWDGFRKDKRVSERVDSDFRTAGGVGNYNKRILSKEVLKPITSTISKIRSEHARLTHPWCYDGVSLLPSKLYFPYTSIMRALKDALSSHVDNLATQLPIYIANQKPILGDLFNIEDYPQPNDIRSAYDVSYSFFPVPQSDHFIIDFETAEAEKIRTDLQKELSAVQTAAVDRLYKQVTEMVEHVHERLSDPANVFHKSMLENIDQLVKVLPSLNIFNDERLDHVCQELKSKILIVDADDLRKDQNARQEIAHNAYDIMALLKGETAMKKAA